MEWIVAKTGFEMFDALHAYGLGIILAEATGRTVQLSNEGVVYRLDGSAEVSTRRDAEEIIDTVVCLPTLQQLQDAPKKLSLLDLSFANLDGLLAAHFTIPGVRRASVSDLLAAQKNEKLVEDGLRKINGALSRWKRGLKQLSRGSEGWLSNALKDYDPNCPSVPRVERKQDNDISVLMTIDPAFSCSYYSPVGDGRIATKTNLTVCDAQYAPLFAFIGAARFLRAQRVANKMVNFYIPIISLVELTADTRLPLLDSMQLPAEQAIVYQWLTFHQLFSSKIQLEGLAYQTLLTQGASQSISVGRGCSDYHWLSRLVDQTGPRLMNRWRFSLRRNAKENSVEIDILVECLLKPSPAACICHLHDLALCLHRETECGVRAFNLLELKEVIRAMDPGKSLPLSSILERESGTLHFGRAMRLLGQVNNGALCEIVDELETVHSANQLIQLLGFAVQECEVAKTKSPFITVPSEDDLKYLLDDIEQYSAQTIARLLFILSTVRYPPAR